jgi:hypothetical protein
MDRVNPQTGFDPAHPNIVQVPQFYFILKAAQVGLSILILALSGASIGLLGGYVYYGGPSYSIFVVSSAKLTEPQKTSVNSLVS